MAPKASIHSLPPEIKARIADLCRLQDRVFPRVFDALKERAREPTVRVYYSDDEDDSDHESCDDETDVFKMGPFSDRRAEDPHYPQSLVSLSCVSKEWRDVAVKILFRVRPLSLACRGFEALFFTDATFEEGTQQVTAYQCSKPIFLFAIAPRYGHLVQDLDLEFWPFDCSISNILASLAYLSRVRKVALPAIAAVSDLLVGTASGGNFPVEFASPAYIAGALQRVTLHADTVSLNRDDLRNTLSIVRGTNLRTLNVTPTREDLPALFSAILACPNLRTLNITTPPSERSMFKNSRSLPNLFHPTLRRLDISDLSGGKGLYDFIGHFASSLEELEVYLYTEPRVNAVPPDPGRINLPRLQRLKITGGLATTAPLVQHISPHTFPALQTCTWGISRLIGQEVQSAFAAQVADIIGHQRDQQAGRAVPLRLTINVPFDQAVVGSSLEALGIGIGIEQGGSGLGVGFAHPEPIDLGPIDLPDLILTPKLCRADDSEVSELGKVVRGSLDRIRNLADQAIAVGDRFQISRIAHALQEGEWLCVEREC
jgi:hypothetical protein